MYFKLFLLLAFLSSGNPSEKNTLYLKEFYETGRTKAEGWIKNGLKEGYWRFYHKNGKIAQKGTYYNGNREAYWYFYTENGKPQQQGHYLNDKMTDWWLFYDAFGKIDHKCQLSEGIKNGYCLQYSNEELASAEKYENGKKIKIWTSFSSFRRENKLSDLK